MAGESGHSRQRPTEAEAAALTTVHEKMTELLNALRDARVAIRHEGLSTLVNQQIDRQLQLEEQLLSAFAEYTGQPIQDPY